VERSILQPAIKLAGLFTFVSCLAYVSAVEAAAPKSGTRTNIAAGVLTQPFAQEPGAANHRRTPTPTRTPTRTPTNTPTNTPIPSCGLAWRLGSVAEPGSSSSNLTGAEVVSANDVWAVGSFYETATNHNQALIEHWNGTQWSVVPSPSFGSAHNFLYATSAVSANDVWAIGYRYGASGTLTLIEHWNGTQWSVVPSPSPGSNENYLLGLAAVSANDVWAVGYHRSGPPFVALVMHWDGKQWSVLPDPNPSVNSNVLTALTAISANDVWAVGYYLAPNTSRNQTLTNHWNGSNWSVVPSPDFNQLYAVSAISSNDVWAVGANGLYDIRLHWNGSNWSEFPGPEPNNDAIYLNGVTAVSANDVWAVGYYFSNLEGQYKALIEHWDGSQWSEVESQGFGSDAILLGGTAAVSANDVWAVGLNGNTYHAAVARYNDPCAKVASSP
jgi:superoxide dismutase